MHLSSNIRGALFAALGFSLFACGDAVFKYLTPHYSAYIIAFYASFFALLTLLAVATFNGGIRAAAKTNRLKFHLLRGVIISAQVVLVIIAFNNLSLAKTYAIVFIAPFLATILSIPLLKESVRPQQWLSVALGFSGVLIVLRPGMIPLEPAVLAALGSAVLFALGNLMVRIIGMKGESRLSFAIYVEAVIFIVTGLFVMMDFVWPTMPHMAFMIIAGVLGAGGMYFLSRGFAEAPAAVAAPFHYIQMLWGVVLGYLIFGDTIDIWVAMGGGIIILSGLWLIWQEKTGGAATKVAAPMPPP